MGTRGWTMHPCSLRLNEVRPRRPEQYCGDGVGECPGARLNEVRPRRPEQSRWLSNAAVTAEAVSMKSGLEGRNNAQELGGMTVTVQSQ